MSCETHTFFHRIIRLLAIAAVCVTIVACQPAKPINESSDDAATAGEESEIVAVEIPDAEDAASESIDSVVEEPGSDESGSDESGSEESGSEDPTSEGSTSRASNSEQQTAAAAPEENKQASHTNPTTTQSPTASTVVELGSPELTAGIPGSGTLTLEEIKAWLDQAENHVELDVQLPLGLKAAADNITGLEQNPMTRAKIELGRQLYFDTRLSLDNSVSCASCHHPDEGYGRHTQFGEGVHGQTGNRNSPVSYNRIVSGPQFWDGRAESLEAQAVGPMANPIEMGNTHENAVSTVAGIEGYRLQFEKIFPGEGVTIDNLGKAIATFERAIVTAPAPYDYLEIVRAVEKQWEDELEELEDEDPELFRRYEMAQQQIAHLSESAIRGRDLFFSEKSNCTACHAGANFSDELYHNIGVGMDAEEPDVGRFAETQAPIDTGAFKTPTLRNVALSAPYMHDGSQQTLEEVVEWYAKGGHPNIYLSEKIKKLDLTDQDKADLVAFMQEALTSDFPPVEIARLPE